MLVSLKFSDHRLQVCLFITILNSAYTLRLFLNDIFSQLCDNLLLYIFVSLYNYHSYTAQLPLS